MTGTVVSNNMKECAHLRQNRGMLESLKALQDRGEAVTS